MFKFWLAIMVFKDPILVNVKITSKVVLRDSRILSFKQKAFVLITYQQFEDELHNSSL